MIKLFITIILNVILFIFETITRPLDNLLVNFFPNMSIYLNNINSMLSTYVFPYFSWFLDLLPANVVVALFVYFNFYLTLNWFIVIPVIVT